MIRIPTGNENSTRIEVRSVGSDTNPYLLTYTLLKVGLEGPKAQVKETKRQRTRVLPGNIHDSLRIFKASDLMTDVMGVEAKERYSELKEKVADRAHKELGKSVKKSEVIYHHEVTNQYLWNQF
jgi:glutamine synthetase